MTGCDIATPTTVYAWTDNKEKFDSLKIEGRIHDWTPDKITTMLKNDGQAWERRVHSKTVEQSGVLVIIQYFEERPMEERS